MRPSLSAHRDFSWTPYGEISGSAPTGPPNHARTSSNFGRRTRARLASWRCARAPLAWIALGQRRQPGPQGGSRSSRRRGRRRRGGGRQEGDITRRSGGEKAKIGYHILDSERTSMCYWEGKPTENQKQPAPGARSYVFAQRMSDEHRSLLLSLILLLFLSLSLCLSLSLSLSICAPCASSRR